MKWTSATTEGFTADDLHKLNEAQAHLEARAPGLDPATIAAVLNNAWTDDADARVLERRAARWLGLD